MTNKLSPLQAGSCNKVLASGFDNGNTGNKVFEYCGDIPGAIYLQSSINGGVYDDMEIDCDGVGSSCSDDPSSQPTTAFADTVGKFGISDLNTFIHPWVVFGNDGTNPSFDPQEFGMEPLSIMAVVCNIQLVCRSIAYHTPIFNIN